MSDWLDTLVSLRASGAPAVLVTVATTKGSAPRDAGTKMVVTASDVHGTIGGGHLEHKAIAIARDQLAARSASDMPLRRFPLGASLGQCCGGIVNLLFEPIAPGVAWIDALVAARAAGNDAVVVAAVDRESTPEKLVVTRDAMHGSIDAALDAAATDIARALLADGGAPRLATVDCRNDASRATGRTLFFDAVRATDFNVVLFGAGHVARAIVHVLATVALHITWVDAREGEFPRDVPANVSVSCTDVPEAEIDAAPKGAYFLVMTHSHALDEALAERVLRRGDYAYFGLIGSITKRRAFENRLARRGVPADRLATITCPIGVAGIPGKEPAAIAIAVAAEILQVRARAAATREVRDTRRA